MNNGLVLCNQRRMRGTSLVLLSPRILPRALFPCSHPPFVASTAFHVGLFVVFISSFTPNLRLTSSASSDKHRHLRCDSRTAAIYVKNKYTDTAKRNGGPRLRTSQHSIRKSGGRYQFASLAPFFAAFAISEGGFAFASDIARRRTRT